MVDAVNRDRDAAGRPRSARPRDALGRPLERSGGDAAVPVDPPAGPPRQTLADAQRLLDAGRPFAAHEVLEAQWKATTGAERDLWRGLAQLAVALTHHARGNARGAAALFERAADTLAPLAGTTPYDVPVDQLRRWAQAGADGSTGGLPPPRLHAQAADDRA
ncbi:MAG TPA: DUF309 domain-containing protein [Mycobacteriales bacterium]|nr:DUF309 domain-containing protein [Mycobacteriales bacterium]